MASEAQKAKIKAAKDAARPFITNILAAQALVDKAQADAAPVIAGLIKAANEPGPFKFKDESGNVVLVSFRATGDKTEAGAPIYGLKVRADDPADD